ncbi:hypothetical protein HY988_07480 [Candidatus Micrarchaeota archaeon]|nr:hypothetical protein [Candidatus Micrarchaeota archaeon]
MSETKLELNGMSCNSCEKIISRVAQSNGAVVKEIDAQKGYVVLDVDEQVLAQLKTELANKGFYEKGSVQDRGNPERVKSYLFSIIAGQEHVQVESKLFNYAIGSAAVLIIALTLGYLFLFNNINPALIPILTLIIPLSVGTVFSYYHLRCYRKDLSCNLGMMMGMTIGMLFGFMVGALIGATNGMFIGSVVGISAGIGIGLHLGKWCGIMGAMEGAMAGLMSGLMGAMTSVMLVNDNLIAFLYLFFGACGLVLFGLSYMMFREAGSASKAELNIDFGRFTLLGGYILTALLLIMLYAPKGPIIYG